MTVRLTQPPASLAKTPDELGWLEQIARLTAAVVSSGTTAERPKATTVSTTRTLGSILYVGRPYFDTTLNKPIWIKSIAGDNTIDWVDATGASV